MSALTPSRARSGVLVSYARADGERFARELRQQIADRQIKVWRDREDMHGGRGWWLQIVEGLSQVEYMVLVMTPGAMVSEVVQKEWRQARQEGVVVMPVIAAPGLDIEALPGWMRAVHWYDLHHQRDRFFNDLNQRRTTVRVPFMAEPLPADFVPREVELRRLKSLLLRPARDQPVAVTAALRGAGGYGKTTLARALCWDDDVQTAFFDGTLWVTLGAEPGPSGLLNRVADLVETLSGERPGFLSLEAALNRFRELLADREILLVIDDVWYRHDLEPFLQGGPRCARLVTTRRRDSLPSTATQVEVDAMDSVEAAALLETGMKGSPNAVGQQHAVELRALVERLGHWPLLLKLGNAWLRRRLADGQPLGAALTAFGEALDKRGVTAFDATNPQHRHDAAARTLELSLDGLSSGDRARLQDLAVFEEDQKIPFVVLEQWWRGHAALSALEVEEVCQRLRGESLLLECDLAVRFVQLHDVVRSWLIDRLGSSGLAERHGDLIEAYRRSGQRWAEVPDDGYLHRYLPWHLAGAGRGDELRATLLDLDWMALRLSLGPGRSPSPGAAAGGDVDGLARAYEAAWSDKDLQGVSWALRMSTHVLQHEPSQLPQQLYGRLGGAASPVLRALGERASARIASDGLLPLLPGLVPPGPLALILTGHTSAVGGALVLKDGRIAVSWSDDRTLRLWDLVVGKALHTLRAHRGAIGGISPIGDERRLLSWSDDGEVLLWDVESGELLRRLAGHFARVLGAVPLAEGRRALSWSDDGTMRLWDLQCGKAIGTQHGYEGGVDGAALLADGKRVLWWSPSGAMWIWGLTRSRPPRRLQGHDGRVLGVAQLADGQRAVSWSRDGTARLWDLKQGALVRELEGHRSWQYGPDAYDELRGGVAQVDRQHIVSWSGASDDPALLVSGVDRKATYRLDGHAGAIAGVAPLKGGKQLLSWSSDGEILVWDLPRRLEAASLGGHADAVNGMALLPDAGKLLSWSADHTLRLWDLRTGSTVQAFRHEGAVVGAIVLDGEQRALSWSVDGSLRLWDLGGGAPGEMRPGHQGRVVHALPVAQGMQVLSASHDRTLRLWDSEKGTLLRTMQGHASGIAGIEVVDDGRRALSWSPDGELKLWDLERGAEVCTLSDPGGIEAWAGWGDDDPEVACAAVLPGGREALSWGIGNSLRLWDLVSGELLAKLEGSWHGGAARFVQVLGDGRFAVSLSYFGTPTLWDLEHSQQVETALRPSQRGVDLPTFARARGSCLLPGGRRLLCYFEEGFLTLADFDSGRLVLNGEAHDGAVRGAASLADGRRAVTWSSDETLRLWEVEGLTELQILQGREARVDGAKVLARGEGLLTWTEGGTMRLWDLRTGALRQTFSGHQSVVTGGMLLNNGTGMVSWSTDRTLRLWDMSSGDCVGRYFTDYAMTAVCAVESLGRVLAFDAGGDVHLLRL